MVVWRNGAHLGGNANNGANAGLAYLNSNNSPANANADIGSRLYCTFIVIKMSRTSLAKDLATWQKITGRIFSLVARMKVRINVPTI